MRIRLFSGNGMRAALAELAGPFERAAGHAFDVSYDPAKIVLRRIESGESADAALLGEDVLEQLVAQGRIEPGSCCRLVRNGIGVAVRRGAPRPDISSLEAFRRALLAAPAIAFTTHGASGIHFAEVIDRLGIGPQVRAKARTQPGGLVAELVAAGDAELAVQQIPELLAVPGVDLVGPLPAEVQKIGVTAGGVFARAPAREPALALLAFLRSAPAAAVFRARGFEPLV